MKQKLYWFFISCIYLKFINFFPSLPCFSLFIILDIDYWSELRADLLTSFLPHSNNWLTVQTPMGYCKTNKQNPSACTALNDLSLLLRNHFTGLVRIYLTSRKCIYLPIGLSTPLVYIFQFFSFPQELMLFLPSHMLLQSPSSVYGEFLSFF
jgi:hypothetical protein